MLSNYLINDFMNDCMKKSKAPFIHPAVSCKSVLGTSDAKLNQSTFSPKGTYNVMAETDTSIMITWVINDPMEICPENYLWNNDH